MATDDARTHRGVREQLIAPAISRAEPTIHSIAGALDDVDCSFERLKVLFTSALSEMTDLVTLMPAAGGMVSASLASRFHDNCMICEIVGEKLDDLASLIAAINAKAWTDHGAALV